MSVKSQSKGSKRQTSNTGRTARKSAKSATKPLSAKVGYDLSPSAFNVNIRTIDHSQQRYDTVGDWIDGGEVLEIRVSNLGDWRYNALIAIHELVEVVLLQGHVGRYGSPGFAWIQKKVDEFDMAYEKARPPADFSEPGDSPEAPYHIQHGYATAAERMVCAALGLAWARYNGDVESL